MKYIGSGPRPLLHLSRLKELGGQVSALQPLPEAAISLRVYGGAKVNALPLLRIALPPLL